MALHLIKLCVGAETLADLAGRQAERLAAKRVAGEVPELGHLTRHTPKRAAEILPDGSLYWVMKGRIVARQRLLELRPVVRNDVRRCLLVLDPELVTVAPQPRRPFQGWRYLEGEDAPPDSGVWRHDPEQSAELERELIALGLI
jgi:hypothetical protein